MCLLQRTLVTTNGVHKLFAGLPLRLFTIDEVVDFIGNLEDDYEVDNLVAIPPDNVGGIIGMKQMKNRK